MAEAPAKPIGRKAYGSIGHLPSSKLGPGDYCVHEGQARICTERPRDKHDRVIVQEKLDGSCCAVAKVDGKLHAITRKGWPARTSPFEQHHLFADWVDANASRFDAVLNEGERLVGEWLAQAHGTLYRPLEPFVAFDLMTGTTRLPYDEFWGRVMMHFITPRRIYLAPISPVEAYNRCVQLSMASQPEGVIYRVERHGKVDFLAKWVRPDFVPGCYLPEISGQEAVWNWQPESAVKP